MCFRELVARLVQARDGKVKDENDFEHLRSTLTHDAYEVTLRVQVPNNHILFKY